MCCQKGTPLEDRTPHPRCVSGQTPEVPQAWHVAVPDIELPPDKNVALKLHCIAARKPQKAYEYVAPEENSSRLTSRRTMLERHRATKSSETGTGAGSR